MSTKDQPQRVYDVIVVGAGPAGLCACALLQERNCDFLLIDAGRSIHERSRHDPLQCAEGVGGAGLFSDGKFSFYPSSSALWQLPDRPLLQRSYQRVVRDLQEYGLGGADGLPSFPTTAIEKKESTEEEGREEGKGEEWELKRYPSFYMSLEDRLRLTQRYADGLPALLETKVMDITFKRQNGTDKEEEAEDLVCCKVVVQRRQREQPHKTKVSAESSSSEEEEEEEEEHNEKEDGEEAQLLYCKRLIFGGGRFGPLLFPKQESVFRRMEVGVRVQDRSHNPFFSRVKLLDPKYKLTIPSSSFFHSSLDTEGRTEEEAATIEWRTFCCCREGEVVEAGPGGFFSGRSDCPPTGLSNIGFNLRCCSEKDALLCGQKLGNDFQGPLLRFLAEREDCFVAVGLRKLCDSFPELLTESSQVIGPTMEGVGFYPELEEGGGLRSRHHRNLWIVGDSSGVFRGIVAAMVSGYYVAQEVLETLSKKMH